MNNLNEELKKLILNHENNTLQDCFGVNEELIDKFSKTMASISPQMDDMQLTKIVEHVLDNVEINTLPELICLMFVCGMGVAESKHKEGLERMRNDVLDMAINLKAKDGQPIKPQDFISEESLRKIIDDSKGDEF